MSFERKLCCNEIFHVNAVFKLIPSTTLSHFVYRVSPFSNVIFSKIVHFFSPGSSFANINSKARSSFLKMTEKGIILYNCL